MLLRCESLEPPLSVSGPVSDIGSPFRSEPLKLDLFSWGTRTPIATSRRCRRAPPLESPVETTSHPDVREMNGLPVSNDDVAVGLNETNGGPYLTAPPAAAAVRWLALPEILSIRPD
jgi:hypothetical protein